jgi:hypothetical protein
MAAPHEPRPAGACPWPATRQGRRELAAAGLFVAAFALVPLVRAELYPFSRAPMFADAPRCYCEYAVTDPSGKPLDLLAFGLQRNYWGNPPGAGVGFEPPSSLDVFGQVPRHVAVTAQVRERLAAFPRLPYVDVQQTVIRPVDDRPVEPRRSALWRVDNPYYRGPAQ